MIAFFSREFGLAILPISQSKDIEARWVEGCTLWLDHLAGSSFGHTLEWAPQIATLADEVTSGAFDRCSAIDWGFAHSSDSASVNATLFTDTDDLLRAAFGRIFPLCSVRAAQRFALREFFCRPLVLQHFGILRVGPFFEAQC